MSFSKIEFAGTLQRSGVIRLPKLIGAKAAVEIEVPGTTCAVLTRVLHDVHGSYVIAPRALLRCLTLPLTGTFKISTSKHEPDRVTLLPTTELRVLVTAYKHKAAVSIVVPSSWQRGLQIRRWDHVDVELEHEGRTASFPAQLHLDRTQIVIGVPAQLVEKMKLEHKDRIYVVLRPRESGLDGGTTLIEEGAARWSRAGGRRSLSVRDGVVVPVSTWMSARFKAVTPLTCDLAWLLGFYQAEGTKSVPTFSIGQKSPWLLKRCVRILCETFGFSSQDLALEVLYGSVSEEETVRMYTECGVEIANVRYIEPQGAVVLTHSANLYVKNGKPFAEAFQWGLNRIVDGVEELPLEMKHAFFVGFIDGDGTITLNDATELEMFTSGARETLVARSMAAAALGDGEKEHVVARNPGNESVTRSLSLRGMVWLLRNGAFAAGSSRPKLFHAVYKSLGHIRDRTNGKRQLATGEYEALMSEMAILDDEWAYVQSTYPTIKSTNAGKKGVLYCYPKTVW